MGKHLLVSAVIALFLELVLLIALAVLPIQILGQTVITVSMPLGLLLIHVLPDGFAYALTPEGGASAAAFVFGISMIITWFVIFWIVCFAVRWRTRATV